MTTRSRPQGATDPTSWYTYSAQGHLTDAHDRAGGHKQLISTAAGVEYHTHAAAGDDRVTTYVTDETDPVETTRTTTFPNGAVTSGVTGSEGQSTVTYPDGTEVEKLLAPDPRFGLTSPLLGSLTVDTITGPRLYLEQEGTVSYDTGGNLQSFDYTTKIYKSPSEPVDYTRTFNVSTRWWTFTTPMGYQHQVQLTSLGKVFRVQRAGLAPVQYSYHTTTNTSTGAYLGRLSQIDVENSARVYDFKYNSEGRLYSIEGPLGLQSMMVTYDQYDAAGRLEQMILPGGRIVTFSYDANGNVTAITPPRDPATFGSDPLAWPTHSFGYDVIDQLDGYDAPPIPADPIPTATTYQYNDARQVELITRPSGDQIDLVYEQNTGVLERADLGLFWHEYTYNTAGQLTGLTRTDQRATPDHPTIHLTFGYQGFLPMSETWTSDGTSRGIVTIEYDNLFRVIRRDVEGGSSVTSTTHFVYDDDGFPRGANPATPCDPGTVTCLLTATRNPTHGLLGSISFGASDELQTTVTHNSFGELQSRSTNYQSSSQRYSETIITRDDLGRITSRSEQVNGDAVTTDDYEYDTAGRLWKVYRNAGSVLVEEFGYDYNGNRTSYDNYDTITHWTGTVDHQDRLDTYGPYTYQYTDDGVLEIKTDTTTTDEVLYSYDAAGSLLSVTFDGGPNDDTEVRYIIDGRNRRIGRELYRTSTGARLPGDSGRYFLYRDSLNPVGEVSAAGALLISYVYVTRSNVPDYLTNHEPGKEGTYRILSDHLGSPRAVVRLSDGMVVERLDYTAFGHLTRTTYLLEADYTPIPFGFASGIHDEYTGLVRFGARDYDPETSRWLSKDPILFGGGSTNVFEYTANDPVNRIDPAGRRSDASLGISGTGSISSAGLWSPGETSVTPSLTNGSSTTLWQGLAQALFSWLDFLSNYSRMREANTIGGDKYFHCMANCQAAKRGTVGRAFAYFLGGVREIVDLFTGDSPEECAEDAMVNRYGRHPEPGVPCNEWCKPLRPNGLPEMY